MMLSLFKKELMYEHLNMKTAQTSPNFVIAIQSESVDEDYKRLIGKGVEFINEPHNVPGWGDRCVHLKDPEGNILEINQTLQSDLWDDDLKSHKDAEKIMKNL